MRRTTRAAAALSAAALSLTACAQASSSAGSGAPGPSSPAANVKPAVLVGDVRTVKAGALSAADIGTAQRAFGLDVFKALCASSKTPNVTLSPSSLADMLGLIDAGSSGATRAAMAKLLHLPAWGDDVIAAQQSRTAALKSLANDKSARVVISNHVWAQVGAAPTQAYLDDVKTAFDADLRTVDFGKHPTQATNAINASVKHDTDGMIEKLFDQPLDPATVDVLTNAVVLDAKWAEPFDSDSADGTFTTAKGGVPVKMMSASHGTFDWTSAGGWQAATLPYVGNTLSAVAILPPTGTKSCAAPTSADLTSLLGAKQGETTVLLPKLHLEQTYDQLLATLVKLGLPAAGDFSAIYPGASLSQVVQKVVMDVDEQGTKAAAATGGGMTMSAIFAGHTLSFNRPFLFLIRDTATGSPLFLTWVGDPTHP